MGQNRKFYNVFWSTVFWSVVYLNNNLSQLFKAENSAISINSELVSRLIKIELQWFWSIVSFKDNCSNLLGHNSYTSGSGVILFLQLKAMHSSFFTYQTHRLSRTCHSRVPGRLGWLKQSTQHPSSILAPAGA